MRSPGEVLRPPLCRTRGQHHPRAVAIRYRAPFRGWSSMEGLACFHQPEEWRCRLARYACQASNACRGSGAGTGGRGLCGSVSCMEPFRPPSAKEGADDVGRREKALPAAPSTRMSLAPSFIRFMLVSDRKNDCIRLLQHGRAKQLARTTRQQASIPLAAPLPPACTSLCRLSIRPGQRGSHKACVSEASGVL